MRDYILQPNLIGILILSLSHPKSMYQIVVQLVASHRPYMALVIGYFFGNIIQVNIGCKLSGRSTSVHSTMTVSLLL